jgi:hypothetical protein
VPRESKRSFITRLLQEGRHNEWMTRLNELVAQGTPRKEAEQQLRSSGEFRKGYVKPVPEAPPLFPSETGSATYWQILEWVCDAKGREKAGGAVKQDECPSAKAWGMLDWAKRYPKDFYNLWVSEGRKQSGDTGEEKRAAKLQVEEIRQMIEEAAKCSEPR